MSGVTVTKIARAGGVELIEMNEGNFKRGAILRHALKVPPEST